MLDTSSVKVFLPGITDTTTLQAASTLCGQASWKIRGQEHASRHDVATPDMIRQLPAGFALVIRGGCAPVIARLPRAWKNPAYRRARHHAPRPDGAHPGLGAAPGRQPARRPRSARARRADPRPRHRLPLELTMTSNDPITALADQLAACGEQLTRLDAREAAHYTALTALLTGLTAHPAPGEDPGGYQPGPPPPWWKLTPGDRQEPSRPAARLGRAGLPARLRPPGRHPRPLLARPRPVPVRPGHPGRACGPSSTSSPTAPPRC